MLTIHSHIHACRNSFLHIKKTCFLSSTCFANFPPSYCLSFDFGLFFFFAILFLFGKNFNFFPIYLISSRFCALFIKGTEIQNYALKILKIWVINPFLKKLDSTVKTKVLLYISEHKIYIFKL